MRKSGDVERNVQSGNKSGKPNVTWILDTQAEMPIRTASPNKWI
jgi:hypothetical protein